MERSLHQPRCQRGELPAAEIGVKTFHFSLKSLQCEMESSLVHSEGKSGDDGEKRDSEEMGILKWCHRGESDSL